MPESSKESLKRLREMDEALIRMEKELPEDVRAVGALARRRVATCIERLSSGSAAPGELQETLREVAQMMDALTARLLLVPWDPPRGKLKS
jgi:hypothetical protein